jgi:hypothetical protein
MGIDDTFSRIPNAIVYFLFLIFINVILINLLIGIAVGEIKTVLDEADLQRISLQIVYVLKVESTIKPFQKLIWSNNYKTYTRYYTSKGNEEKGEMNNGWLRKTLRKLMLSFRSKKLVVNLIDPQKRLEETLMLTSKRTNDQLISIKSLLSNQSSGVDVKLNNSQMKIEDTVRDLARSTSSSLDNLNERFISSFDSLLSSVTRGQKEIGESNARLLKEMLNIQSLHASRFEALDELFSSSVETSMKRINSYFDFLNCYVCQKFFNLDKNLEKFDEKYEQEMDKLFNNAILRSLSAKSNETTILNKMKSIQESLNQMQEQIMLLKAVVEKKS